MKAFRFVRDVGNDQNHVDVREIEKGVTVQYFINCEPCTAAPILIEDMSFYAIMDSVNSDGYVLQGVIV